jgi:dopamine beta-monooxygenase
MQIFHLHIKVLLLVGLYAAAIANCQSQGEEAAFKYKTILDHENRVQLEWNVNKASKLVRFKLVLVNFKPPYLFGFGMSDHGEFTNADFVVFDIQQNGSLAYFDAFTDKNGILKRDTRQNWELVNFKLLKRNAEITVERKFDTCDPRDYRIEWGTVHVVHFVALNGVSNNLSVVGLKQKAMKQTQLIKSTYFDKSIEYFDETKHKKFEVVNKRVRIPSDETTYWCTVFKLDRQFEAKHHVIGYESLISENSKGVVHHMELFHCITDPPDKMKTFSGVCKSEEKPAGLTQCRKVVAAWAMGASRFVYPENVGGIIGGKNYSPYLVLEIHYDNPNMRSDIVDSSGMRVYYQGGADEQLRQYDAGILEVGLEYNAKNSIPPKMNAFTLNGFCLSECTKAAVLPSGITIFASQLHTHLTGRKVWTSLVRNRKVVRLINSDNHYDQMFQEIRLLPRPVKVRPGDGIVNTCVYETNDRRSMTFGGYSIRNEMCVNYIHYYPHIELEVCKSSISDAMLSKFFEKMSYFDRANTSVSKSVEENFDSIRWTPLTASMLGKLYEVSPISFSCNKSNGEHVKSIYSKSDARKYFNSMKVKNLNTKRAPVDADLREQCTDGLAANDVPSGGSYNQEEEDYENDEEYGDSDGFASFDGSDINY